MRLPSDEFSQVRQCAMRKLAETWSFGSNPGQLRMWAYVPHGLREGAPLVVVLHGCGQSASAYANGAGWCALADRLGFAVLAPEQSPSNNMNGCFNWFLPDDVARGRGEAASIREMVDTLVGALGLDARRVFVTGLSAGGAMACALLAAYPEVFAGGAIIAGLPYAAAGTLSEALRAMQKPASRTPREWGDAVRRASPHKERRPKISIWHGDADFTVSPANAEALVAQWTDLHELAGGRFESTADGGHRRRIWRNSAGTAMVEAHLVRGMGHGTPILADGSAEACGTTGPFILSADISSSSMIAAFWGLTIAKASIFEEAVVLSKESSSDPLEASLFAPMNADKRETGIGKVITDALRAAGLLK